MPGARLHSHTVAPLVTDPWRQDLQGTMASPDAACLEHGWPQESAFLTTHTHTRTEEKLERGRWKGVGRERTGLSYVVYPCNLLWLP